jgi:hypothetical protein
VAYEAASARVVNAGDLKSCRKLLLGDIENLGAPCMEVSSEVVEPFMHALKGKTYIDTNDGGESWTVYDVAYHDIHDTVVAFIYITDGELCPTCNAECEFICARELHNNTGSWAKWVNDDSSDEDEQ